MGVRNEFPHPSKDKEKNSLQKRKRSAAKRHFERSSLEGEVQRHTYYARVDLLEKLQGYAYCERFGISKLINHILEEFFEGKEVKPCPPKRSRYRWRTNTKPKRSTH